MVIKMNTFFTLQARFFRLSFIHNLNGDKRRKELKRKGI